MRWELRRSFAGAAGYVAADTIMRIYATPRATDEEVIAAAGRRMRTIS